jgi:hypothetical protein
MKLPCRFPVHFPSCLTHATLIFLIISDSCVRAGGCGECGKCRPAAAVSEGAVRSRAPAASALPSLLWLHLQVLPDVPGGPAHVHARRGVWRVLRAAAGRRGEAVCGYRPGLERWSRGEGRPFVDIVLD